MINYFFVIFILNFSIFYFYRPIGKFYNLFDYPDAKRKLHKTPTALLGGLILIINLLVILIFKIFFTDLLDINFFIYSKDYYYFFFTTILFFIIGYIDDKYHLSANLKLLLTIISLIISLFLDKGILLKDLKFSFLNYSFNLDKYSYFITILCFLLFINAFNMLDGINAQVVSYIIFIFLILIFKKVIVIFSISILLTFIFFLFLNFKNKAFLGDSGTLSLGYMISYIFIKSYNLNNSFFADEIFLIMCIPGYELLRLAIERALKNKHPFLADNNHIHHILIKRYKFNKAFLFIQILLISPYLMYCLINNFFIVLVISLIFYISIIYSNFLKNLFFNYKN